MAAEPFWIQFAREPVLGQVKTRLQGLLGEEGALELHCELVLHTTRQLIAAEQGPVTLAVTGEPEHPLFRQCVEDGCTGITLQEGGDLGERMYNALAQALTTHSRVLLVGSDCPGLDTDYCASAVRALDKHDLVLGPAEDGGYVLIGARRILPGVFRDVAWGSSSVLEDTLDRAGACELSVGLLEERRDIDDPDDYRWWQRAGGR